MAELSVSRISNRPLRRLAIVVNFPLAVFLVFSIGVGVAASMAWRRMSKAYGAVWRI
jgi:hypothetical protein